MSTPEQSSESMSKLGSRLGSRPGPMLRVLLGMPKWAVMGGVWVVQSGVVLVVMMIWMWQAGSVSPEHPLGNVSKVHELGEVLGAWQFWAWYGGVCVAAGVLQAGVMLPVAKPRARMHRGVPLLLSAGISGLLVSALVCGIVMAGLQVYSETMRSRAARDVQAPEAAPAPPLSTGAASPAPANTGMANNRAAVWRQWVEALVLIGVVGVPWIVGTVLVWAFCSRRLRAGQRWEAVLRSVASRVFMGTIVEVIAIIPMDVMVRRKTDCYCFAGTLIGLTLGLGVGVIVLGPIILLPLVAARRKRWYQGRCDACGYDLSAQLAGGRGVERCPECGSGWKP